MNRRLSILVDSALQVSDACDYAGRVMQRTALAIVVAGLALGWPTAFAAQASWLDSPPTTWNTPGATVPTAPPLTNPDPACHSSEIAAATPEQQQLATRGWKLQSFWPPISSGGVVVIGALAEYGGMCRPFEFNVFVFSGGQYAGTLSPVNMNSRTDGSLFLAGPNQVATIGASGTIAADFIRYADTDPLCCPSRGTTHVVYRIDHPSGGPVVVPDALTARAGAPAQVPSRLPATGAADRPLSLPLVASALGLVLIGLGLSARRGRFT
ncbi:MAG TPA: LppP/LprE family lipoprotein [Chloroflexota bacterium]